MITSSQLTKALRLLSEEEKDQAKVLDKFFAFLKHYSLEGLLPGVLAELTRQREEEKKLSSLEITTSHPLSEKSEEHIKKIIDAPAKVLVQKGIKKELLGGFKARYQGFEYQGSLSSQVDILERQLASENN